MLGEGIGRIRRLCAWASLACVLCACDSHQEVAAKTPVARHGCLDCHAASASGAPDFGAISARYAGSPDASLTLAGSLKSGSHGKWSGYGGRAMPAQPQLSEAERQALVQWILEQRR